MFDEAWRSRPNIENGARGKDTVKLFLASSIDEFRAERNELGYFFSKFNNILIRHGLFARLIMCEDLSDAMAKGRMQDVYNEEISKCDLFYAMLRRRVGSYTIEEFEVAHKSMLATGKPKITILLQEPESNSRLTEEASHFMRRLSSEFKYPHSSFSSLDQVKLTMLRDIEKSAPFDIELDVQETSVYVLGRRLADIDPCKR